MASTVDYVRVVQILEQRTVLASLGPNRLRNTPSSARDAGTRRMEGENRLRLEPWNLHAWNLHDASWRCGLRGSHSSNCPSVWW